MKTPGWRATEPGKGTNKKQYQEHGEFAAPVNEECFTALLAGPPVSLIEDAQVERVVISYQGREVFVEIDPSTTITARGAWHSESLFVADSFVIEEVEI